MRPARRGSRRVQLLRVEADAPAFTPLIAAVQEAGLRVGWLVLSADRPPADLEEAAASGVLRAVAVGDGSTTAVKRLRGAPVLDDLLREHFSGCRLVLVRAREGEVEAPELEPAGEGRWRLTGAAGRPAQMTSEEIVRRLRSRFLLRTVTIK